MYASLYLPKTNTNKLSMLTLTDVKSIISLKLKIFMSQFKNSLFYDRNIGNSVDEFIHEQDLDKVKNDLQRTLEEELMYSVEGLSNLNVEVTAKDVVEYNTVIKQYKIIITFKINGVSHEFVENIKAD